MQTDLSSRFSSLTVRSRHTVREFVAGIGEGSAKTGFWFLGAAGAVGVGAYHLAPALPHNSLVIAGHGGTACVTLAAIAVFNFMSASLDHAVNGRRPALLPEPDNKAHYLGQICKFIGALAIGCTTAYGTSVIVSPTLKGLQDGINSGATIETTPQQSKPVQLILP